MKGKETGSESNCTVQANVEKGGDLTKANILKNKNWSKSSESQVSIMSMTFFAINCKEHCLKNMLECISLTRMLKLK